jgi:hypothetical protein
MKTIQKEKQIVREGQSVKTLWPSLFGGFPFHFSKQHSN